MIDIALTLIGFTAILAVGLKLFERKVISLVDAIGDIFEELLTAPAVSKAMGIIGKKSGQVRSDNVMIDKMAMDILNGPKFATLKTGASVIGIDIESYIEENGALQTLRTMKELGGAVGIDVGDIMSGGLSELPGQTGGKTAYL